jgi:hypothetical protein
MLKTKQVRHAFHNKIVPISVKNNTKPAGCPRGFEKSSVVF